MNEQEPEEEQYHPLVYCAMFALVPSALYYLNDRDVTNTLIIYVLSLVACILIWLAFKFWAVTWWVIKAAFIVWVVSSLFNSWGNSGKYEGRTAKDWYYRYSYSENRYREFRSCVEDYDNFDKATQARYGGVFYYCE